MTAPQLPTTLRPGTPAFLRANIGLLSDIRVALVVYRDEGDEYVTRRFEFTGDLASLRRQLGAQQASGGGDLPLIFFFFFFFGREG